MSNNIIDNYCTKLETVREQLEEIKKWTDDHEELTVTFYDGIPSRIDVAEVGAVQISLASIISKLPTIKQSS